MKTLYMTKGLPASGKTTWAKERMAECPGSCKRVNKDELRSMVDLGKHSPDNEKFILGARDYVVTAALNAGKHVIVDDTNLASRHEERLMQLAKGCGAAFEVVDFTHVPVDECLARDKKRANYVGEQVIRSMWKQFLAPKPSLVAHGDSLPYCVLVDVDGTLALMNDRGPFEWERVGEDLPNQPVVDLVRMVETAQVIYLSARDECCRAATQTWIEDQGGLVVGALRLHMRPAGDMRDDRIVKREIYEREIKGKYNVLFVLDDRPKVVRMWREIGLFVFDCGDGVDF